MLNSLLHLRQLVSARKELWGDGAGPLRRGMPVVVRSAMMMSEDKSLHLAHVVLKPRGHLALLNKPSTQFYPVLEPVRTRSL